VKKLLIPLGIALATAASGAWAKAPADATGECKDGTYTTSATREGACSSHGGVKKWMAKEDKSSKSSAKEEKSSSKSAAKEEKSSSKSTKTAAAEKPANATGECKDGTYTDAASKSGACSGHKGVKTWYGAKEEKSSGSSSSMGASKTSKEMGGSSSSMGSSHSSMGTSGSSMGSSSSSSMGSSSSSKGGSTASSKSAAAGGGNGKVWVNTDSKVYHCESDALYGKTKQGEYMTESQAKASGARAARGKECA